jgi:endonuclease/exonuclease/phosphatase family metal-dependent hydrolase
MKILQLNVWGGRLGKQIVDLLKKEDADVVCLQEAIEMPGSESFLIEDLDEIKSKAGYEYCFFTPVFGYKLMNRYAKSGLAILSKTPFSYTHDFFTRLEYIDNFDILDTDYNVRSLQHVTVGEGSHKLNILNHHGHHVPAHKNGDDETLRQCQMIMTTLRNLKVPLFFVAILI